MTLTYDVAVSRDWPATRARWAAIEAPLTATPFQTLSWLDAWYTSYASQADPLLIEVRRGAEIAALFALAVVGSGAQRAITFTDLNVGDFNAPILGAAAPTTTPDAKAMWQAVSRAITRHAPRAHVIDLRKMPPMIAGRPNPLALLHALPVSPLSGHLITLSDWESYHNGLERRVRMEFERCWRHFRRSPSARFERVRDVATANRVIDAMDRQQGARMSDLQTSFLLDRPTEAAFYRHDLEHRLARGDVIITAMFDGDDIVAGLYGFAGAGVPAIVRISNAGGHWATMSPGRLIVHGTIKLLAEEGFHAIDLSIGDYAYKRRMQPVKTPLVDYVAAVSWRGHAHVVKHRAVATLRRHPELEVRLRRLFNRPNPATGRLPELKKTGA